MYYNKETNNNKINVIVSSESSIDLPNQFLKDLSISVIDMKLCLGDNLVSNSKTTPEAIIDFVNENNELPKTSAINSFEYSKYFKKLLNKKDNHEENITNYVVHFALSSKISSSYNNAVDAAENFNGKVIIIDTKTLSTGIALLIIKFNKYLQEEEYLTTALDKINSDIEKVNASLVLEKLKYLKIGGRCSSLIAFGANILKIRPQIIMKKDGSMGLGKMYKGSLEKVLYKYCRDVESNLNTIDLDNIFITYTTLDLEIVNNVKILLKSMGFKNIYVTKARGTITSHCGENCLGLLYLNN